jgi:hypothetical protein
MNIHGVMNFQFYVVRKTWPETPYLNPLVAGKVPGCGMALIINYLKNGLNDL